MVMQGERGPLTHDQRVEIRNRLMPVPDQSSNWVIGALVVALVATNFWWSELQAGLLSSVPSPWDEYASVALVVPGAIPLYYLFRNVSRANWASRYAQLCALKDDELRLRYERQQAKLREELHRRESRGR